MPALILTSGCGCIELRTSSFIIGYISMVLSIIFSTIMLVGILGGAVIAIEGHDEENRRMAAVVMVMFAITLFYVLLMLVFTVVLLMGLHKTKRNLVKVYLIAAAVFFFLDFVMFFVGFVHGHSTGTICVRIIVLILEAYAFLVVRSYYYQMDTTSGQGVTYTTA